MFNRRTVARPTGVFPNTWPPLSSKCSSHLSTRGLKSGTITWVSGSMLVRLGPLYALQRSQASAKPAGSPEPPCCFATICSKWNGMRGVADCFTWQYSHAFAARLRTRSRVCWSNSGSLPRKEATGLCLHYGNNVNSFNEVLVLGVLGWCQRSFICLPAQLVNARLHLRICTKVEKRRGGFRRQCVSQRV